MKLTQPPFVLKRKAKTLARTQQIPLHDALDQVAKQEGYESWSLLAAHFAALSVAGRFFTGFESGNLALVAARPGHGKTLLGIELAMEAIKSGKRSVFFSLEYTEREFYEQLAKVEPNPSQFGELLEFDGSDLICAGYIIQKLQDAEPDALVVIDYLQVLDQRRDTPSLGDQVQALRAFAHLKGIQIVFISQVDRHFDSTAKKTPDLADLRLPNRLDLKLFDRACFLQDGQVSMMKIS